jgi:hypothetical protein
MKRFVELLPPAAGDEEEDEGEDEGRVSLGVWLAGTLLLGAGDVLPPPTLPTGTSCHC